MHPKLAGAARATLPLLLIVVAIVWSAIATAAPGIRPAELRCGYRTNPLGVDDERPELSWVLEFSPAILRDQRQLAYQILVATRTNLLEPANADLWDSGRVESDRMSHIRYAGKPLASNQACWWSVRVWNQEDDASPWSKPAKWTMGLLGPNAWQGKWIASPRKDPALPILRTEFTLSKPVQRALVHYCGLGFGELSVNGSPELNRALDPGWTNYRKRCLYTTRDVTDQLQAGPNALAVMLGNGMYNVTGGRYVKFTGSFGEPKLILQLHIEFKDGTTMEVVSDRRWKSAPGPITFSCIYGGEDYDARLEPQGWDRRRFDDRRWEWAAEVAGPGGALKAQTAPPVKVMDMVDSVQVTEPIPGTFVYDMGRNFSGWPMVALDGPRGKTVKMIPGELLDERGLVTQRSSGGPTSFSYTLKGNGLEGWHPRFSYYGFRYLQVEGATRMHEVGPDARPRIIEIEGRFVHSSARTVGLFACSNPLLNRIHELIDAAILSNLQSVLTDCPHREKLGWLEVSHLLGPAIMFNYDVPLLYRKISDDMAEAQLPNGLVPDIAPEYVVFSDGFRDSPEWGSACVINPWHIYQRYGDTNILGANYDPMKRYVEFLGTRAKDQIVSHGLGDWYDVGPGAPGASKLTTQGVTGTAVYYQDLEVLRQTAALLGKEDDAKEFSRTAAKVREAFNRRFFNPETNSYDRGSQTADAMPLALGLAEPDRRARILESLVRSVRSQSNHVTAGDVGFRYLLQALAQGGRSDVIYELAVQPEPPGYLDQINKGATTLTEAWDANPDSSQNHCMLGHIEEWFYAGLAGIQPDPQHPGFRHFFIKPEFVGDLSWVEASYDSMSGLIRSAWKRQGTGLTLNVTIPPNTSAQVSIPAADANEIKERGKPVKGAKGVKFARTEGGRAIFEVASGHYEFTTGVSK